jgi:hypothetical protein
MPTGLDLPSKTVRGKLQTVSGKTQNLKITMILAGPRQNANPWNKAGIEIAPFELDGPDLRGRITQGVREHFGRLKAQQRMELRAIDFRQTDNDLEVTIEYFDIVEGEKAKAVFNVGQAFAFGAGG